MQRTTEKLVWELIGLERQTSVERLVNLGNLARKCRGVKTLMKGLQEGQQEITTPEERDEEIDGDWNDKVYKEDVAVMLLR